MSTKLACPVVAPMEICPNCKSEMTITEVTPILLADGFENVTYRRVPKLKRHDPSIFYHQRLSYVP
jgi:hypothetical protein